VEPNPRKASGHQSSIVDRNRRQVLNRQLDSVNARLDSVNAQRSQDSVSTSNSRLDFDLDGTLIWSREINQIVKRGDRAHLQPHLRAAEMKRRPIGAAFVSSNCHC
jgi:hypothetical protein